MRWFRWMFLFGLAPLQNCVFAKTYGEHCGSVPSNEEMNAVLRPTSLLIMACLPVVERYNMKLSVLFEFATDVCEFFEKCFKEEIFNLAPNSPSVICLEDIIREKVVNTLPENVRDVCVNDMISCISSLDKMKKSEVFAVMHWYLSLAP